MNFKFNEDEQKVIDLIHEFGANEVAPLAAVMAKEMEMAVKRLW